MTDKPAMSRGRRACMAAAALVLACVGTASAHGEPTRQILVVGHRGASGERPEHTATGYRLAVDQGADFIEPDLVMTKDSVLIDRHENEIGGTTDVAAHPEFASRRTTKVVDGQKIEGWFSEDFTLAEIKTLRARERLPELRPANTAYDGRDEVLTFQEVIDLAKAESARTGRTIGVYAELKHPTYFAGAGLPMEEVFVRTVRKAGLASRGAAFIAQSFELGALRKIRARADLRTVFLIDSEGAPADFVAAGDPRTYADMVRPEALREIAATADGIGPAKTLVIARDGAERSLAPTSLVADAHAAGLTVHPFTFRSENAFLPAELRAKGTGAPQDAGLHGDARAEYLQFFAAGVDGVFSDFPEAAVTARRDFEAAR